jgi:hypothetical protein
VGPAHNQLLSPLTQYLGVCDDAEAGIVTLPFEHAVFLRRMKSMRYSAGTDENGRSDRLPVLRERGVEMAKVLGAIPRLPGSLNGDTGGPDTLVHLRLVLSAAQPAHVKRNPLRRAGILGRAAGPRRADMTAPAPAHESLTGFWHLPEYVPKKHFDWQTRTESRRMNRGRRRTIPPRSLVHAAAFERGEENCKRLPPEQEFR